MHWDWLKWFRFLKVESLDTIELLPLLSYGASFDQFMIIKTFSK